MREFKVNDFITLKLKNGKTIIYINNNEFRICKSLKIQTTLDSINSNIRKINSTDEFIDKFKNFNYENEVYIKPETEFWGHSSNIQAWAENNYDTRILHRELAFPLLRALSNAGDTFARRIYKDEILRRLTDDYVPTSIYLIMNKYLRDFNKEEFETLIDAIRDLDKNLDEKNLDLIKSYDEEYVNSILNANEIIFLIEHKKINLLELLLLYSQKYFDIEKECTNEFKELIDYLLDTLIEKRPRFLSKKVHELINDGLIILNDKNDIDISKANDFSFRLYNSVKYGIYGSRKHI